MRIYSAVSYIRVLYNGKGDALKYVGDKNSSFRWTHFVTSESQHTYTATMCVEITFLFFALRSDNENIG